MTEEAGQPGWRADVLATRGTDRLAFEVQVSGQTLAAMQSRQARYAAHGVRGVWLCGTVPSGYRPASDLAAFKLLALEDGQFAVEVGHRQASLRDLIEGVLYDRVRFADHLAAPAIQVVQLLFCELECWKCKKVAHHYVVGRGYSTPCGYEFQRLQSGQGTHSEAGEQDDDEADLEEESEEEDEGSDWPTSYEFLPEIISAVEQHADALNGAGVRLGAVKPRYSGTMGMSYTSFGCHWCDAIWGEFYMGEERSLALMGVTTPEAVMEVQVKVPDPPRVASPHWCFPPDEQYCA